MQNVDNVSNTKEKELLKPKYDVVFQSLFNQKNENITKNMVSAFLDEKISSIKINNDKELLRDFPEDKLGILDLEAEVNGNEKIDIEVQLVDRKNLAERLLWYFSKLYTLEKGKNYKDLKKVVLIAIIDYEFDLTKELKRLETIWSLREKFAPNLVLTQKLEIRIIELRKALYEYKKDKSNPKAQWSLFINNPNSEEVKELMKENQEIEEANEEVEKMSEDTKLRRLAFLKEKAILDEVAIFDAGLDKGIAKGLKQSEEKIIKLTREKREKENIIKQKQNIIEQKENIIEQKQNMINQNNAFLKRILNTIKKVSLLQLNLLFLLL